MEKRLLSVNMFNDELDERELQLDELNEKFFMYVFKALLYTKNRRILYQLLDVINFYIKHATPYQSDVINPDTILWMLKIIDTHREDSDLCLLAAKTVLKVVNNHQIVFDYQEMAIIKKFNNALDNIAGKEATEDGGRSDSSQSFGKLQSPFKPHVVDKKVSSVADAVEQDGARDLEKELPKLNLEVKRFSEATPDE